MPTPPLQTMTMTEPVSPLPPGRSPAARAWRRFKSNKLGFYSLLLFVVLVVLSLVPLRRYSLDASAVEGLR